MMMPGLKFAGIFMTPELALVIGNLYSFLTGIKQRPMLKLKKINKLATNIYEYVFEPHRKFSFIPGQYMEITLPVKKVDERGNRRNFTIASSPDDKNIRIGVKFYDPSSKFKTVLKNMNPGQIVSVNNLAGDFTLPEDKDKKLAFIAGGIGVTPFRSMASHMIGTGQNRDAVLFYSAAEKSELAYQEIFKSAEKLGLETVFILSGGKPPTGWRGEKGRITPDIIKQHAPDFKDRIFYISGPVDMVNSTKKILNNMGIKSGHIKTDYFAGY